MRTQALSGLILGGLLALAATGQTPGSPKPAEPKKATLEDDITKALRAHPDIQVAEAEAQLANAKLQQAKLAVSQRVTAAKAEKEQAAVEVLMAMRRLESLRRTADVTGKQYEGMRRLGNQVATTEVAQLELAFDKAKLAALEQEQVIELAKAKAAAAEAGYDALVGKAAPKPTSVVARLDEAQQKFLDASLLEYRRSALLHSKPGSVAERLRTALAKSVTFEAKGMSVASVVHALKTAAGLDLMVRTPGANESYTFTFEKQTLPLAAWLELLRDEYATRLVADEAKKLDWYVREYGLSFSPSGRPEGAMTLSEFTKAVQQEADKPKASEKKE